MAETPLNLYWDSCLFLAYVNEEPERVQVVSDVLEESAVDTVKIFTSDISRVEVAFSITERDAQVLDPYTETQIDGLWDDNIVTMVDFHVGIAMLARSLARQAVLKGWSMKPYDAIHLATAQWLSENGIHIDGFHTFDDKLKKFSAIMGFNICAPYTQAPRMF